MAEEVQISMDGMHKAKRQSEFFFVAPSTLDNSENSKMIVEFYFADANLPYDHFFGK